MTDPSQQGIIVLGMPRSGTTLLRRILDGHPAICAPAETFLFRAASRFLESEEIAFGIDYGVFGGLKPLGFSEERILKSVRGLAFGFYEELAQRAGKRRWAAKTAVDSFYAAAIERLCAGHARFVCVLRHGLDVVCSLKEFSDELQGYIAELRPYVQRYPRPLEAFAHAWVDVTTSLLALVERNPECAIALRYEDLVASPEATLSRLFAFLGERWDVGLLRQAFENREVAGLGDWKTYATSGLKSESIERWKELPDDMVGRLSAIVNPTLAACSYPPVEEKRKLSNDEAMRLYELAMMFKAARAGGSAAE
jgi:protein-tyrosine sulfotransferase